jgi:hypothetical protein
MQQNPWKEIGPKNPIKGDVKCKMSMVKGKKKGFIGCLAQSSKVNEYSSHGNLCGGFP